MKWFNIDELPGDFSSGIIDVFMFGLVFIITYFN